MDPRRRWDHSRYGLHRKTATAVDCGLTVGGWITAYLGGGDDSIGQLVATGQLWEVHGGPGNDTIRGDNAENWLFGDEGDDFVRGWMGNDVIDGGPGVDALYGDRSIFLTPEGGDDTITSRDTEPDEVWCDYGFDTVTADALDTIDLDCEQVDRGVAPAVTPPAITPPAITPPSAAPPTVAPPASKALPRMTVSTAKRYVKRALAKRYRGWRKGTHRVLAKPLRVSRVTVKFRSVSVRYRAHTYRGWAQAKYYLKGGKVHVRTTVHLKRR